MGLWFTSDVELVFIRWIHLLAMVYYVYIYFGWGFMMSSLFRYIALWMQTKSFERWLRERKVVDDRSSIHDRGVAKWKWRCNAPAQINMAFTRCVWYHNSDIYMDEPVETGEIFIVTDQLSNIRVPYHQSHNAHNFIAFLSIDQDAFFI